MKHKTVWAVLCIAVVGALVLASLPVGSVTAQQNATPTPGSGWSIPTATSPGDTSAPAAGSAVSDSVLETLVLGPEDVPTQFTAGYQTGKLSDATKQLRENYPTKVDDIQDVVNDYGWNTAIVSYASLCDPTIPFAFIYSEVSALAGPASPTDFITDPRVIGIYVNTDARLTSVSDVDAIEITWTPPSASCFDAETATSLMFVKDGFLVRIVLQMDQRTDNTLVSNVLNQLIGTILNRIAALSGPQEAPAVLAPTEAVAQLPTVPAQPTAPAQPAAAPLEGGLLAAASATPLAAGTDPAFRQIEAAAPTLDELGLPQPLYRIDATRTGIVTVDELLEVASEASGYSNTDEFFNPSPDAMAGIVYQTERDTYGLAGKVTTTWNVGQNCSRITEIYEVSSVVEIYDSAAGASSALASSSLWMLMQSSGIYDAYQIGSGVVTATRAGVYQCDFWSDVTSYTQVINTGRFNLIATVTAGTNVNAADMQGVANTLNQFVLQKLNAAGIQ
jgi:hypothetical protein